MEVANKINQVKKLVMIVSPNVTLLEILSDDTKEKLIGLWRKDIINRVDSILLQLINKTLNFDEAMIKIEDIYDKLNQVK